MSFTQWLKMEAYPRLVLETITPSVQSLHKHLHPCYRLDHHHHHHYNDKSVSDLMGNIT